MSDLKGGSPADWIVIGWFTPDYRPLAETFAANLAKHNAPYHLFARPPLAGWDTSPKPSVVLDAMSAYPDRTLVLMDVDCIVSGDIAPAVRVAGDVGIVMLASNIKHRNGNWCQQVSIDCSSRIVVFRPTAKARAFAVEWARLIDKGPIRNDEHSMTWAYINCSNVDFCYLDNLYAARGVSEVPDAVIWHDSAHRKQRLQTIGPLKRFWRAIQQSLKTGRTKARKQAEVSPVQPHALRTTTRV